MGTTLVKEDDLISKSWSAIYDKYSLDPDFDPDTARTLADRATALMNDGVAYRTQVKQVKLWNAITNSLASFLRYGAVVAAVLAAVGGIAFGIYTAFHVQANDYAGTDPGSVGDGGYHAIQYYYGQNDLPPNLKLVKKSYSQVDGHAAWFTLWRNPEGKKTCVYVWGSGNIGTPHGTYTKMDENCT